MIRHIVLWRLKSPDDFDKVRETLERQVGRIPGLLAVEVGRSFNTGRRAVDFALICDFEGLIWKRAQWWIRSSPSTGLRTTRR
jgi:hypothetical protein